MNGEAVTLIDDVGTFYERLAADIAGARTSVRVEMYAFQEGAIARTLIEAMAGRADAGVAVSFIYDCVGSHGLTEESLRPLRDAGGRILPYHPIRPGRMKGGPGFSTLFRRDHRKLVVIDDRIWYVGGMNVGERFLDWRDLTLRGEGEPARELAEGFDRVREGRKPPSFKFTPPDQNRPVVVLDSRPTLGVYPVKRMYLGRIKKARRRIWIAQAYFLPRHRLRKALAHAVRRGVDVRVVIPDRSDVAVADLASWRPIKKLVAHEVAVSRYTRGMLHTKMALIDDTLIVGAANLDSMSLYWNRELALMIRDPAIVAEAERLFVSYEGQSIPTTMAMIRSRPWTARLAGWLLRPFHWIL